MMHHIQDFMSDAEFQCFQEFRYSWVAGLKGPEHSPYAGGLFLLLITFGLDYPERPPKLRFLSCCETLGFFLGSILPEI